MTNSVTFSVTIVPAVQPNPVWSGPGIGGIQFPIGVPAVGNIRSFVTDPGGLTDTLSPVVGDPPLPNGVTWDTSIQDYRYDGSGVVASTSGHSVKATNDTNNPIVLKLSDRVDAQYNEAATWALADGALKIPWKNPGADWLDANGLAHGLVPFASAVINNVTLPQTTTWNVTTLVAKLLTSNTGIYLRFLPSGQGNVQFASHRNTTVATPLLTVITSTNPSGFVCPCIADMWIDPSSGALLGTYFRPPALIKFDLSAVTGTLVSASMVLTIVIFGSFGTPATLGVFWLQMPTVQTDPATQIGGVQQGLAAQVVATDSELGGPNFLMTAANPNNPVLVYLNITDDSVLGVDTTVGHFDYPPDLAGQNARPAIPPRYPQTGLTGAQLQLYGRSVAEIAAGGLKGNVYMTLPQYGGIGMVRVRQVGLPDNPGDSTGSNLSIISRATFGSNVKFYHLDGPTQNPYSELYCRWLMMIDADMKLGNVVDGVKLGMGLAGDNPAIITPTPTNPRPDNFFAYRHNIYAASSTNPGIFRSHTYFFDPQSGQGSAQGSSFEWNFGGNNICLKELQIYCIEIHIKVNSFAGLAPNADGLVEFWIDGVKAFRDAARVIRMDPTVAIGTLSGGNNDTALWHMELYHGGTDPPINDISVWYGGAVVSHQYIGPPKKVA